MTNRAIASAGRASLDEDNEVRPAIKKLVKDEFDRGRSIPMVPFPSESTEIQDSPRLTLVVMEPGAEWGGNGELRGRIAEWTKHRGTSPRLYPGSLVWCLKKPGRELREKVEAWLAWKRVKKEIDEGTLGGEFDRADRTEVQSKVGEAEGDAQDEVWASYRFVVLADGQEADGLKTIDLGAGHASAGETLCGRVIAALKSQSLLNESVGAGYIDRNWPPALKQSGAWALSSLRQSFLNGSLTRLLDPDTILRSKVVEFVERGDFGLASGAKPDGAYDRVWYSEPISPDEIVFDADVFLLTKSRAKALKASPATPVTGEPDEPKASPPVEAGPATPEAPQEEASEGDGQPTARTRILRLTGTIPPEVWNRLGTRLLPKLRSGTDLKVGVDFSVTLDAQAAANLENELRQALEDLRLSDRIKIE